ncbi:GNAT family N-acetyltransferase [Oceanobacillus jeddahense]|uniref:GNAT family N-acetyltransferase n=1 Tax=Oceanobacillus jeddahense TaxID=1462527 RepID=UPI000942367A|nr:GNAT family N-acetyltransferase [Oceanobacillus jeddahense]
MGKVNVESWQTTYRGLMSETVLRNLSVKDKKEKWENIIRAGNSTTFVAVDEEETVVGYLNMFIKKSAVGEVTAIYLLKNWQGKGIGKALLLKCFQRFLEQSIHTIQVGVLVGNDSRLFYERMGAELVEEKGIQIDGNVLDLLVYEWKDISENVLA